MNGTYVRISIQNYGSHLKIWQASPIKFTGYHKDMYGTIINLMRSMGIQVHMLKSNDFDPFPIYDLKNPEKNLKHLLQNETDIEIPYIALLDSGLPSILDLDGLFMFEDVNIISGGVIRAQYGYFYLLGIFENNVWIAIGIYIFIMYIIIRLSMNILKRISYRYDKIIANKWTDPFFTVFDSLCVQYPNFEKITLSRFIIWFICLFTCTLINMFICCNFFSKLSSAENPSYINNIHDLLERPNMRFMLKEGFIPNLLQTSPIQSERALYEQAVRTKGIFNIQQTITGSYKSVWAGEAATIYRKRYLFKMVPHFYPCQRNSLSYFHVSNDKITSVLYSIPSRKAMNPFIKKMFYERVSWYVESGLYYYTYERGSDKGLHCQRDLEDKNKAPMLKMRFSNMVLPIIVLIVGYLLATFVLIYSLCFGMQ